jgi:hypothetical protein
MIRNYLRTTQDYLALSEVKHGKKAEATQPQ